MRDRNFTRVHDNIIMGGGGGGGGVGPDMHVTNYEQKRSCIYVLFIFLFSHKIDMYVTQTNNIFTVSIKSSTRQNDPVKMILLAAIEYVEHIFNSEKGMYIGNKSNSITCIDVKHIAHSM